MYIFVSRKARKGAKNLILSVREERLADGQWKVEAQTISLEEVQEKPLKFSV